MTPNNRQKISVRNKRLATLKPILSEWVKLNSRMGHEWSLVRDAPWWYNERALVSLFAGAVWRCGGDAFEEFSEQKRGVRDRPTGRIDLWFAFGKKQFNAEAKQCWVHSEKGPASVRGIVQVLNKARANAGDCIPDGRPRLAIVFGVVLVKKRHRASLNDQIQLMAEIAENPKIKAGAMAYVFPKLRKPLISSDNFIMPGIAVWIREVRRWRSKR